MALVDEIGTLRWAKQSGGALSRDEREALLKQVADVQASIVNGAQLPGISTNEAGLARMDIKRIRIPDSSTARHAEGLVAELCPSALSNHCYRTYLWGSLLAQHDDVVVTDEESFYIASLLHDLGLTEKYFCCNPAIHCFAVEGALAADQFLQQEGWEQTRRDVVAEAITLHLNMLVELSRSPIAHYLSAGAKCDVVGARADDISQRDIREVLQRYPGLGFDQVFAQLLGTEAQARPEGRIALVVANFPPGELFPLGKHAAA